MILLCGGEGAAGLGTGGVFFLLVSYAGPEGRGGHRGIEEVARRRARDGLAPFARARLERRGNAAMPAPAGRPLLRSV